MFTAYDVDRVLGENVKCDVCPSSAEVCISGMNLCAQDADLVYPGWREYLPPPLENITTVEKESGLIGLGKAPNIPMLGF